MNKEELRERYEYETGKSHGNVLFSTTKYACWLEKQIEQMNSSNDIQNVSDCQHPYKHLEINVSVNRVICRECKKLIDAW